MMGPPLTPCVLCNHADWGAEDAPSGRIFSVSCHCGRGTAGYDQQAVIHRWNKSLATDMKEAQESARRSDQERQRQAKIYKAGKKETIEEIEAEFYPKGPSALDKIQEVIDRYMDGPCNEPDIADAHDYLMAISDILEEERK
jgi:hypothetical protein